MQEDRQFGRLDKALGYFLGYRADLPVQEKAKFELLVTRLHNELGQGHSCIRIDEQHREILLKSGLVSENMRTPLILEQDRLYFHRYWLYEKQLAESITEIAARQLPTADYAPLLERFFPRHGHEIDWQREAVNKTLNQAFSIITGGPGTGKTTTVVKLLAILQELTGVTMSIALLAPTGKAAMRLQESVTQNKAALPCSDAIKQCIPEQVSTIHRALGSRSPSPYFKHDAENPLPYDVVVVDEASMVDLALMAKLLDALNSHARLILLGDKDQLASVESGAVLADISAALPEHTHELKKSFRFNSDIKALAVAVNQQHYEQAWTRLKGDDSASASLLDGNIIDYIAAKQFDYLQLIRTGAEYREIFRAFNEFQVLCAVRRGENSVAEINSRVVHSLVRDHQIQLIGVWYIGRPVIVTQNDPSLQLFNGDIGICMADQDQSGRMMVYFERPDGSIVRKYHPSRLPHCETVFAMTIHKSQGSEFDEVLMILPNTINPVLTKELVYTGITRARKTVKLVASQDIFSATLRQKVHRFGGLEQRLKLMKESL